MPETRRNPPVVFQRMVFPSVNPPSWPVAVFGRDGTRCLAPAGGHAFALIELLVAVSVIGLLAALLLPAVSRADLLAKQTACASNMRQIGLAMSAYAADNNLTLPETSHTAAVGQTWIYVLSPYLGDLDKVRICPADPKGPERLSAGGTSYVLNSYLFVPEMDPFGEVVGAPTNDLKRLNALCKTVMAFVCSDLAGVGPANDHTHSSLWSSWNAVTQDISPDRFTLSKCPDHSTGSSNYLYADGHVENHTAAAMKARIDSGENFARPQ